MQTLEIFSRFRDQVNNNPVKTIFLASKGTATLCATKQNKHEQNFLIELSGSEPWL